MSTRSTLIDGDHLRSVMQRVPAPVTVVTASGHSEARGATIGSFTSVSLEPPLVSFNVQKDSQMYDVLDEAGHFAVHLLAEEQPDLCQHFAIPDQPADEQLDPIAYQTDSNDTPILDDAPAVLYCKWHEAFDAGDHTIIVGKVVQLEQRGEAPPILYYDRDYRTVTSADASTA